MCTITISTNFRTPTSHFRIQLQQAFLCSPNILKVFISLLKLATQAKALLPLLEQAKADFQSVSTEKKAADADLLQQMVAAAAAAEKAAKDLDKLAAKDAVKLEASQAQVLVTFNAN